MVIWENHYIYLKFRNLLWQIEEYYLLDTVNISDPDRTAPSNVSYETDWGIWAVHHKACKMNLVGRGDDESHGIYRQQNVRSFGSDHG